MSADAILWRDGPVSAPLSYQVPQGGELLPLTVEASIDGSGASQSFYVVLQVLDPNGRSMGKYRSDAIAAGASADVTWFPGAELEEAGSSGSGFIVAENVVLPSWASSASTVNAIPTGLTAVVTVQGTYTDWNLVLDHGSPDADAQFPSTPSGVTRISTQVGQDADTLYAYPTSHPQTIGHWTQFQINAGSGFAHIEPVGGPYTTPQAGHVYTFHVTGQGQPLTFRINDSPLNDNYGALHIGIAGSPASPSGLEVTDGSTIVSNAAEIDFTSGATVTDGGSGIAQVAITGGGTGTISDITSSGGSITVGSPTGPTTNVDVAASGVAGGTYGDSSHSAQITIGNDGRITSASQVGIAGGSGTIGFEIGYAQITATVNVTDTSESTATAIISSGSLSFDGAPVLAEFFCPSVLCDTGATGDTVTITLFEGATQLGRLGSIKTIATGARNVEPCCLHYRFTPTAGSHTYKVCAFVASTAGTPAISAGAGGTGTLVPAFLRFTKV